MIPKTPVEVLKTQWPGPIVNVVLTCTKTTCFSNNLHYFSEATCFLLPFARKSK